MSGRIDITGEVFGDLQVIKYVGGKKYLTKCLKCGELKELYGHNIRKLIGTTCSRDKVNIDLTGQKIGEWTVLKYLGNKKYLCRCSCGIEREVYKANLLNGSSTSCGHLHNRKYYGDLTGKTFGEWKVLGREGYLYRCQCSCGKIALIGSHDLVSGKTKSCGHNYNKFHDLTGRTFGLWKVVKYAGQQKYLCQCQCEKHTEALIRGQDLLRGSTTSCGCNKGNKIKETLLERYNEIGPNKVANPRSPEAILAASSPAEMEKFIDKLGKGITSIELSKELGLGLHRTLTLLHNYNLIDKVVLNDKVSSAEKDIIEYLKKIYKGNIVASDRTLLGGKELDILLPDKKIGIEFNGSYWHSTVFKNKYYHQNKTMLCLQKGIRLIHIFEYEWNNPDMQEKIKRYLADIVSDTKRVIPGRDTIIQEVDPITSSQFLSKFHLQGDATASIHIGIFGDNELLGVMTLGKPRFSSDYEYEIIRMCFKSGVTVIGGAQKMFKYFISKYNPKSVLTYADMAKFTGNIYLKMGFNLVKGKPITEPNYVWVNIPKNTYLRRYQTTKQKLIEAGYGGYGETEDEIMENLGYLKIHDAGSIRLEYIS